MMIGIKVVITTTHLIFLPMRLSLFYFKRRWKILSCPWPETAHTKHLTDGQLFTNVTHAP